MASESEDPFEDLVRTREPGLRRKAESDDPDAWLAQMILDAYPDTPYEGPEAEGIEW